MHILVTGLTGFTGRHLKTELERHGHRISGLEADLTNIKLLSNDIKRIQPDAVIHLAGIAFVGHGDANAFYQVNLIGTRNLLAALADSAPDVKSVLLASSANVYGNRSSGVITEKTRPHPANDYAISKLAMENMASLWFDQLPIFIVRPFNYTGVGQHLNFLIPKIVQHFREKKRVIELGNLTIARDFGDVRAVCTAYRQLIELSPEGKTINVCSGQASRLTDIIALCEKITSHNIEVKVNPKLVRKNDVDVLVGSHFYLSQLIDDWQPFLLEDTLTWMLNSSH
ncbi:MAG: NAD-dependent epimerase/dehydratase family protein [Cycloclasticus sp.]|jgi:nucleoside-diphosphate-sugar epimerase|nr:NAD-dependent epimerase/dehydratase family protein [Gammaproteobacteria bacterium]